MRVAIIALCATGAMGVTSNALEELKNDGKYRQVHDYMIPGNWEFEQTFDEGGNEPWRKNGSFASVCRDSTQARGASR